MAWAEHQAEMLRQQRADALDWEALADALEYMALCRRHDLAQRIFEVYRDLLRYAYAQDRLVGWGLPVQRDSATAMLRDSPSLRGLLQDPEWLDCLRFRIYEQAITDGSWPTEGLYELPWPIEKALDWRFYPSAAAK